MTSESDKTTARNQGIADFKAGKHFGESPNQGFREDDIELRWQWQKGWLRAQLDAADAAKEKQKV